MSVLAHPKPGLLELEDAERRLKPFARRYVGIRAIPVERVVGTEGRAGAFTRDFKPRHAFSRDRLRSLAAAFPDGDFPPIAAVKLGESYFVVDGHHRVALARRRGAESIDAELTELVARVPLPAGADRVELVLRELERVFLEESGLAEARPGLRLAASRPAIYLELLENLQVHGYHLMRDRGRVLAPAEAAADWYDEVYAPAVGPIDRSRLGRVTRDLPEADLFLLLHRSRRERLPDDGCPALAEIAAADLAPAPTSRRAASFRRRRAGR